MANQPITLTESAANHIQTELNKSKEQKDNIIGLKLGTRISGCSGYAYTLDWVSSDDPSLESYHKFSSHNVDVYVDNKSYELISGTEVDYIQQGISQVMMFNNPHATAECGCGESFTVKDK